MPPLSVIEYLDALTERGPCLTSCPDLYAAHHFGFQRTEETFHGCAVQAVPFALIEAVM
jgi:hypothetical protein